MAIIRGQAYHFDFTARDVTTGQPKTGDAANITVYIVKDGGSLQAATNNPYELSSTNAPGKYRILLTASEMDANSIGFFPKSSTPGVECESFTIATERGSFASVLAMLTTISENTTNIAQQVWQYANRTLSDVSGIVSGVWSASSRIITGLTTAAVDHIWHRLIRDSQPPDGSFGGNLDVRVSTRHPAEPVTVGDYAPTKDPATYILANPSNKLATNASGHVTVGGYASGQSPANYILVNTNNRLLTNTSGHVTVGGYATGQSPNELVLATPANKLATDTSGRVTVGANADKTGYSLTSGEHTQIQSDVQGGMTAQGYTTARAPKLDNLDATVGSRAAPGDAMTLTSGERSNIASVVWNFVVEASVSALGLLRLIAAVVQGNRHTSGNTETYYGLDGTTVRVVGTVDDTGDRVITTRTP